MNSLSEKLESAIRASVRVTVHSVDGTIDDALRSVSAFECHDGGGKTITRVAMEFDVGEVQRVTVVGEGVGKICPSSIGSAMASAGEEAEQVGVFIRAKKDWRQRISDAFTDQGVTI